MVFYGTSLVILRGVHADSYGDLWVWSVHCIFWGYEMMLQSCQVDVVMSRLLTFFLPVASPSEVVGSPSRFVLSMMGIIGWFKIIPRNYTSIYHEYIFYKI